MAKSNYGVDLAVHCKSGDDDLGEQVIPHQGNYGFHFQPNFWGTTLFYCKFAWQNTWKWFDTYIDGREHRGYCSSSITAGGPCLLKLSISPILLKFLNPV
ncbi:hypothetical protein CUMW_261180 [Citrus unshiu]|uniref:S-protein homolog n=1 Tax=Citrus unshiu TaxID=55188 RepID=A0A2H5QUU1_CITUN|nr:hypothetical protein CUMW_261180 [Citrus unshiu]